MISSVIYINDSKLASTAADNSSSTSRRVSSTSVDSPGSPYTPTVNSNTTLTRFHSRVPPNISVYDYLVRLTKFSSLDQTVLLTTLYYIDLLSAVYPSFFINSLTVHRFLLAATTVACKGLRDVFYNNDHYAKVGGVLTTELNILESDFLDKIHYRILPRDSNLLLITHEQMSGQFSVFPSDLGLTIESENAGYNVLTTYYRRMIGLVGNYSNIMHSTGSLVDGPESRDLKGTSQYQQKGFPHNNINYRVNEGFKTTYILEQHYGDSNSGERTLQTAADINLQSQRAARNVSQRSETSPASFKESSNSTRAHTECPCSESANEARTSDFGNVATPLNGESSAKNRKRILVDSTHKTFPSKRMNGTSNVLAEQEPV
ncbi:hypothetical protein ACO0QE_003643 [Hanseniaspora vineae]